MSAIVTATIERHQNQAVNDGDNLTAVREFRVMISEPSSDGALIALSSVDVPVRGSLWGGMYCISRSVKLLTDILKTCYVVTCNYSNGISGSNFQQNKFPWDEDPVCSYDFVSYQKAIEYDFSPDEKLICNSAGDLFETQPLTDFVNLKVTITRNKQSYSPSNAWLLVNSINEDALNIAGLPVQPGMARLLRWSGQKQKYIDALNTEHVYYSELIEIELAGDEDGFDLFLLDCGYNEIKDGNKTRILDANKKPVTVVQLLDGSGGKAAYDAEPVFKPFQQYKKKSWSALVA